MNVIKLLPIHEAQKIAAGEVVQRPANVVKELIENALDAHATTIRLEIDQAGKKRIRIIDNGCGMNGDDAHLCFLPHATSKITSVDQLQTIDTFGFRGEALASICAVSNVTLRTKTSAQENKAGVQISIHNGQKPVHEEVSCNVGCDITIEDLFYNTLPRRKFLKRDETEWHQIITTVHAFCVSNTQIHFTVVRDGTMTLNAPPTKTLDARISQVWGHNTAQNFIAIPEISVDKKTTIQITGMISQPQWWRYNRGNMFFFVNNRAVKNNILSKGVMAGYKNVLPPQKYPGVCLFLTIDQQAIDVNVHPQKDEVHFSHPGLVQRAIAQQVTLALETYTQRTIAPQKTTIPIGIPSTKHAPTSQQISHMPINQAISDSNNNKVIYHESNIDQIVQPKIAQEAKQVTSHTPVSLTIPIAPSPQKNNQETISVEQQPHIIGQLFTTYIMLEKNNDLILIDQHAAHERILYERFAARYAQQDGVRLLFPQLVTVPAHYAEQLHELRDIFAGHGITIDQSSDTQFAITSAPGGSTNISCDEMIMQVIELLANHATVDSAVIRKQVREHVHSHLACKSAIKAGDVLDTTQMQQIINDLAQTKNRFICAHGRPTSWTVPKSTIEKQFKRRL